MSIRNKNNADVPSRLAHKIENFQDDNFAKNSHHMSSAIEIKTTSFSTTTFGSRKRKLPWIEYVKPKINGIAEPFVFRKGVNLDQSIINGMDPNHLRQDAKIASLHVPNNKEQSIDDILNPEQSYALQGILDDRDLPLNSCRDSDQKESEISEANSRNTESGITTEVHECIKSEKLQKLDATGVNKEKLGQAAEDREISGTKNKYPLDHPLDQRTSSSTIERMIHNDEPSVIHAKVSSVASNTLEAKRLNQTDTMYQLDQNAHKSQSKTELQKDQSSTNNHLFSINRCLFSGISVEDAVRDRVGLRPRSNSTDAELRLPQRGLCDEQMVLEKYRWKFESSSRPKGFYNLGNTCYLNSTLQCLAYLPPLCQSMMAMKDAHDIIQYTSSMEGKKISNGKRITLILRSLFLRVHGKQGHSNGGAAISPAAIVKAVPSLGSSGNRSGYKFRPGRQEDAHEFLVHLLDAMHDGELREAGINPHRSGWRDRLPVNRLDETTFIHRIFAGYLRSQVQCTNCRHHSNTYDPFLDLSLEISRKSCTSIIDAFQQFTRKETLDSENRWLCPNCKKRVCAMKQLTVFRPPLCLCIQLKRFAFRGKGNFHGGFSSFGGIGGGTKITKPIEFPAHLNLPLSDGRSCGYALSGIVIHVGGSANSGHYTACVKQSSLNRKDQWFNMDDSDADPISEATVLRQKDAYILFYCRKEVKLEFPAPPRRTSLSSNDAIQQIRSQTHEHKKRDSIEKEEIQSRTTSTMLDDLNSSYEDYISKKNESKSTQPKDYQENFKHDSLCNGTQIISPLDDAGKSVGGPKSIPATAIEEPTTKLGELFSEVPSIKPEELYENMSLTRTQPCHRDLMIAKASNGDNSVIGSFAKELHPKTSNPVPKTSVRLNREGQRVEVVMRSHLKKKANLWKPQTSEGSSKSESFGLLGSLAVSAWDEDSNSNEDQNNSSVVANRSHVLDDLSKKANIRKRKMHKDRWDSFLDQGRTKKVKKGAHTINVPLYNPFQRIGDGIQKMKQGKPKGHEYVRTKAFQKRR